MYVCNIQETCMYFKEEKYQCNLDFLNILLITMKVATAASLKKDFEVFRQSSTEEGLSCSLTFSL